MSSPGSVKNRSDGTSGKAAGLGTRKTVPAQPPAAKALTKAALDEYEQTGDLRYLCLHYHYHAIAMRKQYEDKGAWADLARLYRLRSRYFACAASITGESNHACEMHLHLALYWQTCFENTRKRSYWYAYLKALRDYFGTLARGNPDPLYAVAEEHFNSLYEEGAAK